MPEIGDRPWRTWQRLRTSTSVAELSLDQIPVQSRFTNVPHEVGIGGALVVGARQHFLRDSMSPIDFTSIIFLRVIVGIRPVPCCSCPVIAGVSVQSACIEGRTTILTSPRLSGPIALSAVVCRYSSQATSSEQALHSRRQGLAKHLQWHQI